MLESGFDTLKDICQVVVVPFVVVLIAFLLPRLLEDRRRAAFLRLIRREFLEMKPYPKEPTEGKWVNHLKKQFLHEQIFDNVSSNRDFILSLDENLAYFLSQLWINFDKAKNTTVDSEFREFSKQWIYYLFMACNKMRLVLKIYVPWENLFVDYEMYDLLPDERRKLRPPPSP